MNDINPKYDPAYEDMTPAADLCSEKRCAEYRDEIECRLQGVEAKLRAANLLNEQYLGQIREQAKTIEKQSAEVERLAKERDVLKIWGERADEAAIEAIKEVKALKLQIDEARKALEIISEFDARDFAQFGAQALMDAVAVAKIGLSKMKPTEKRVDGQQKSCAFHVEPLPKDWDGSPKGCWDQHPLTREICQLKPDGHTTHKRDDTTGKQLLCWVRS